MKSFWGRVLIAFLILLFDAVIFFIPIGALLLAYVVVVRPPWFRAGIDRLYEID